jgi:7,8-dihydropterin-6-yl-methyl-4-(beta-D-ribofuranosyl)aminobenzene 5'-phosphate synthase
MLTDMQAAKSVRITTLADNVVYVSRLLGQFGFSAHLEIRGNKDKKHFLVFDTGSNKNAVLHNIKALKLDLTPVESIVLSHGHYDHTSATVEIAKKATGKVKVYAHPNAFQPKYKTKKGKKEPHGMPKGEGRTEIERTGAQIIETVQPTEIFPGVMASGEIPRITSFERLTWKNMTIIDGNPVGDKLLDDQALFINLAQKGVLVICGCAHAGLINTLEHALKVTKTKRLFGFIGGTHLINTRETRFKETVAHLKKLDLQLISPAHCTGYKSIAALNHAFQDEFVLNYAGRVIDTAKKLKNPVL